MNLKKGLIQILTIILLIHSVSFGNSIIYQDVKESELSTGVVLKEYNLLTEDGWVKAYIAETDLEDEYTSLGLLKSEDGVSKLSSTMAMTKFKNAIVGINADFFSGRAGKGHAIGLAVESGEIITSATYENNSKDQFVTLYFNEKNSPFYEYFKNEITIYCGKNKEEIKATDINKYSLDLSIPSIYTRAWGEYSIGSTEELPVVEVVVEDDEVVEIRENEEATKIPENGYVITAYGKGADLLKENLKKGSKVSYEIKFTPDVKKINFAISGGAVLVANGIIPESFSHNINGRNPRTAIGTNKKGDKVYLICVDGRIKDSIGMTQQEFAEFLSAEKIYNAINLDGGGSTTMVARRIGEKEITEINTPSEGTERLVANGVGVLNSAPETEKLEELIINIEENNIFVGEKEKVEVLGFNKYRNPVEIDIDDVDWDYEGVEIKYSDGFITGNTVGSSNLIAKIGKIKASIEVNILSEVNEIVVTPKEININPTESVSYTLQCKNRNGYYASTDNTTFVTKIEKYYKNNIEEKIPEDAKFENFNFTAKSSGTYILSFSKGTCKTFAKVVIASHEFILLDDFEKKDFSFDPYPDEVGGEATLSKEFHHAGEASARLDYDFDTESKVRGAYIVMDEPIVVPKDATSIAFWVYNEIYKEEKLKIKMLDGNNDVRIIIIQDNISHSGWNEIIYNVGNYVLPLKITDIYVAQNDENIRNKGTIYVDDFGYYTNKVISNDNVSIPKDEKIEDKNNTSIRGISSFDIAFLDSIDDSKTMINWLKNQKLFDSINKDSDLLFFTNNISTKCENIFIKSGDFVDNKNDSKYYVPSYETISKDTLKNVGYDVFSYDSCTIITMDISQNSIRKSDSTQFKHIEGDIVDDETGNVILVLNNTIDNFEDLKERRVFVDMLCELKRKTKKNIIVVHNGYFQDYSMERGVKFLAVNNSVLDFKNYAKAQYLLLSINNHEISYEYKNIF